jgi:hypothetical protein
MPHSGKGRKVSVILGIHLEGYKNLGLLRVHYGNLDFHSSAIIFSDFCVFLYVLNTYFRLAC